MLTGMPTGLPPGDHEDFILDSSINPYGDNVGARIISKATSGLGMNYSVVVDGKSQKIIKINDNQESRFNGIFDSNDTEHSVSLVPIGDWTFIPNGIDATIQQQAFESDKGNSIQLDFDIPIEQGSYGDNGQFSTWNLTGFQRFKNLRPVNELKTRGELDIILTSNGSIYTLTLTLNGYDVAQGTRTGNGVLQLSPLNGSKLSGTVSISYSQDLPLGIAKFQARYAKSFNIFDNLSPVKTIEEPGLANRISTRIGPLNSGIHNIQVQGISDTGINGNLSASGISSIPGRPSAAGRVNLVGSGTYQNTRIMFNQSPTANVIYKVFDSKIDEPVNLHGEVDSFTGSGIISRTLPTLQGPITNGYRRVIVSSTLNGIEDGARNSIKIEYDSNGNVILPRPNDIGFRISSISGRTLTLGFSYSSIEENGIPSQVNLYITLDPSGFNWATAIPDSTFDISSTSNIKTGTISFTVPQNDFWYYILRVQTAQGTLNLRQDFKGPVLLSNASTTPPSPSNFVVK